MSAEAIAAVIADIRDGNVVNTLPHDKDLYDACLANAQLGTVVDATAIYADLVARDDPVWIYEDHSCIAPPWINARFAYRNEHGNVIVMAASADERPLWIERKPAWKEDQHPVDWTSVRWTITTTVWIGGRSREVGGAFPTAGPVHLWRFAVADDGQPLDLNWVHLLDEYPMQQWDMAHLTLLGALNFCACSNVEIVEPDRPRAERRRIERTGIRVHTLNVFPAGKRTRGSKGEPVGGTPLHSVRGHFATYGSGGRGLLFGRHAGRFWVPAHARGNPEHGRVDKDYRLKGAT